MGETLIRNTIITMKKPLLYLPIVALTLALGACDKAASERKDAADKKADAMEKSAEAQKDAADSKAHEIKAQGEEQKKEVKKEADAVRDQKQP